MKIPATPHTFLDVYSIIFMHINTVCCLIKYIWMYVDLFSIKRRYFKIYRCLASIRLFAITLKSLPTKISIINPHIVLTSAY